MLRSSEQFFPITTTRRIVTNCEDNNNDVVLDGRVVPGAGNPSDSVGEAGSGLGGGGNSSIPWPPESKFGNSSSSSSSSSIGNIHPGHVLLLTSAPLLYSAWKTYQLPLDPVVENVLLRQSQQQPQSNASHQSSSSTVTKQHHHKQQVKLKQQVRPDALLKSADEGIRRAIGSAVAGRALKVATLGSAGMFGIGLSMFFYVNNYRSVDEAVTSLQDWGHNWRRQFDDAIGLHPDKRVDRDHPEAVAVSKMSDEEEMKYVSDTYLPGVDDEADED